MESCNENRDVTPVGSPARVKRDILVIVLGAFWSIQYFGTILGIFGGIQAVVVIGEPLCDMYRNLLLSSNKFTWSHLMKIEM